jgi:hypothetical protein
MDSDLLFYMNQTLNIQNDFIDTEVSAVDLFNLLG